MTGGEAGTYRTARRGSGNRNTGGGTNGRAFTEDLGKKIEKQTREDLALRNH
jgi:hypothetical protein